jgi:hypothetical protein
MDSGQENNLMVLAAYTFLTVNISKASSGKDRQVERVDTSMLMDQHTRATSTRTRLRDKVYIHQKMCSLRVGGRARDLQPATTL